MPVHYSERWRRLASKLIENNKISRQCRSVHKNYCTYEAGSCWQTVSNVSRKLAKVCSIQYGVGVLKLLPVLDENFYDQLMPLNKLKVFLISRGARGIFGKVSPFLILRNVSTIYSFLSFRHTEPLSYENILDLLTNYFYLS